MSNPYAPPGQRAPGAEEPPRQGPPPPQSGPERPPPAPRRPVDKEQAKQASRWLGRYALLVLGSLLVLDLPLPWKASGLVLSVAAMVVGVLALRAVLRARTSRSAGVMLGSALVMTAFIVLYNVVVLAAWPIVAEVEECRERALTIRAQEECQSLLDERMRLITPDSSP